MVAKNNSENRYKNSKDRKLQLDKQYKIAWNELTLPGAEYELTRTQIRGQSILEFVNAPKNIGEFWNATQIHGERDYLVYKDERITYKRAHEITASVANWLFENNITSGDCVAIAMRNYPEWLLIYWACLSVGITAVGMNAWWVTDEMEYALQDSKPKAIFCDVERLQRIKPVLNQFPDMKLIAVRTPALENMTSWTEIIQTKATMPVVDVDPDHDACVFYTSGTTGLPKGALLTHRGCINTLKNVNFFSESTKLAVIRTDKLPKSNAIVYPVGLVTTPLFHVTANNVLSYQTTAAGGTLVLMYKWDAGDALRLIETHKISALSGVPTMSREVLNHPDIDKYDLSSLLTLTGGGAPLPPDLVHQIDKKDIPAIPIVGYGMTETCGLISAIAGDFLVEKPSSVGRILPNLEVRIVDDNHNIKKAGEVGEVTIRGASIIKGYLNRQKDTSETIIDGWLQTGDLGYIDEDEYLFLVDRKKDMVLRGGENVYCTEVESALFSHPHVSEACVFGTPDERLGEEVAASILLLPDQKISADELRHYLSSRIAKHKIPRFIWFATNPLPRNATGKFVRKDIKASLKVEDAL